MDGIRVLYAEDDPADRELTLHHLRRHAPEIELRVVGSGRETVEALRGEAFDLVLLDYRMPDVDGLRLLRDVLASTPEVPVVMVTGSGDHEVAIAALKTGAIDYVIKKPGHLDRLPAALREALGRSRHERSRRASRLRVLYAEHDSADVDLTLRHLAVHAAHLQVETASTGGAALRKLEAGGYDLLLLDYRMPDLNGLEILQEMRQRGIRLPVVMVTGQGDEETAVQALKLGVTDYVVKREGYLTRLPSTIENTIAQRALADEKEALLTLNGIAKAVASTLDLDEVLRRVAAAAASLLRVERSLVSLLSDEGSELVPVAWHGGSAEEASCLRFPVGQDVPGRAAAERRAVSVPDIRLTDDATYRKLAVLDGVGGVLSVPIVVRDHLLGALTVAGTGRRAFTPSEEALLTALAAHAAVGIENARLFRHAQEHLDKLQGFYQATKLLTSERFLDTLLRQAVEQAARVIGARYGAISVFNEAGKPQMFIHTGLSAEEAAQIGGPPEGKGILGIPQREGRPIRLDDLTRDPRAHGFPPHHPAMKRFLGVPITSKGNILGQLYLTDKETGPFTAEDEALFTSFGEIIAGLIENAKLYEELRRAALHLEAKVEDRTRELQTANFRLEEAMRQVEEASRHKSEFLANMSHELRTPLNAIIGFSELLLGQAVGPLADKQARYLAHIHNGGKHLLQLISDVLDLAKVEAGKIILQPEALQVAEILEDILMIARGLANKKAQTLEAEIEPNLPPLHADPVRFKQILFNLLSNAVKFTPDGGRVTVTARRVDWSSSQIVDSSEPVDRLTTQPIDATGEWLEIAVTDTGIGIKPEDLPRLFQEFVQLERTQAQKHEGAGLGLALTKKLVEMHGGRIRAESEGEGRGSTFTVLLPLAKREQ